MDRATRFPIGATVTVEQLDRDPHPVLARLRAREPVSWVPALDGWLVTRHDHVVAAMRDPETFTVDDPRFSTGQLVGPSMLSLDGAEHARHRTPFVAPFRPLAVRERFAEPVAAEARELVDSFAGEGRVELRRSFAGPMAAAIVARALGLARAEVPSVLGWYDAIVAAVTEITAGAGPGEAGRRAFGELNERLHEAIAAGGGRDSLLAAAANGSDLSEAQVISNAAVLLFGGIETTEGMIANAVVHLLEHPLASRETDSLPAAIEESLRLEPAAAVVDRYATRSTALGGAEIGAGELVRLSISAANRDPQICPDPDRFDATRPDRRHLAFAHGPHVCVGIHLARLEARTALATLFERLPKLRLDPARPPEIRGLVFRKPPSLHVIWE